MRITKKRLLEIIKEEVGIIKEAAVPGSPEALESLRVWLSKQRAATFAMVKMMEGLGWERIGEQNKVHEYGDEALSYTVYEMILEPDNPWGGDSLTELGVTSFRRPHNSEDAASSIFIGWMPSKSPWATLESISHENKTLNEAIARQQEYEEPHEEWREDMTALQELTVAQNEASERMTENMKEGIPGKLVGWKKSPFSQGYSIQQWEKGNVDPSTGTGSTAGGQIRSFALALDDDFLTSMDREGNASEIWIGPAFWFGHPAA